MQVRILYQAVAIITLAAVSFVGSPTAMAQNTCDKVVGNFNWTDPNAWDNCGVTFPNNAGTDNANVQVGGTLTLDQNITINNLTLSTGGIAGDNDLTTNGNLEWTGGAMSGTGTTRAAGGLLLGGTGLKDLQGSRSLVNASGQTANWNDGSVRLLTTNNSLLNEASGTFNISADGSSMFGSGTFDNQGSVIVNLSDAGQTVVIGNAFDNDGTLDVQQGRVDLSGGGTSAGDFAGSADAVLEFGGLTHTLTFGASITATNVEVTGGTVNVGNGTTYNVGNTSVSLAGTLAINDGSQTGTLTITNGALDGNSLFTVTGQTTWSGGAMVGGGTTRAEGGLELSGNALKDMQEGRDLVNVSGQTASWTGGSVRLLTTSNALINEANATFNISADGASLFGSGNFDNDGAIVVNLSDPGQAVVIGADLNNDGSVNAQQGRADLSGGGTSDGSFTGGADGIIEFGGATHNLTANSSVTATNVEVTGGTVNVDGSYNAGNTTISTVGTLTMNVTGQTGTLTQTGGALSGSGEFTASGQTIWNGGAMSGTGTLRAEGGLALGGTSLKDAQGSRTVVNASGQTGSWTQGNVRLLTANNTLVNEASATFNISADGASFFGGGTFDNQGNVIVNLSAPGNAVAVSTAFDNDGSVNAQQGTLDLSGGGDSDGSFTSDANGTIEFGGLTHNLSGSSSVTATNVEVTGGTTNVDGAYNTGATGISGVGTLNMNTDGQTGTLTQTAGALGGSGLFTATGQTTWNGGAMGGTGTTRAEGGLELGGSSLKDMQGSRSLVNASGQDANWTEGNIRLLGADNTLVNEASATFNISADGASFFGSGMVDNQGAAVVNLSAAGETVGFSTAFDNDGSIDVQQGTLDLSGGGDSDGTYTGGPDGALEFGGGTHNLSTMSAVTAENVIQTGGTTNVDGTYNAGATGISGVGTMNMNTNGQTGIFSMSGGALGGSGEFTVTGQTTWNGGGMGGTGTTRAEGGLELGTTTLKDMQGSRTLVNVSGQTADWNDGNIRLLGVDTAIVNQASGTFNVTTADVSLFGSGTFENAGTWNVNLQAGDDVAAVSTNVQHDGTANIQNGTLAINSATGTGSWNVDGGRLEVQVNNDVTTTGAITVSNGGEVELESSATLTGSNLTMDDTATLNAALNVEMALSGRIAFAMTDESAWNLDDSASLAMTGGVGAVVGIWDNWGVLEIGGFDLGTDPDNNIGDPQGFIDNFSIPELIIGEGANVWLSDLINNGNRGGPQGQQEALYVDTLTFLDSEGILNQNGLNLYFNTLVGDAGQIIDVQVPIPPAVWLFSSGIAGLLAFRRRRNGSHN